MSIVEKEISRLLRETADKFDAPDGLLFNRWYADCCYKGIAIPWYDML